MSKNTSTKKAVSKKSTEVAAVAAVAADVPVTEVAVSEVVPAQASVPAAKRPAKRSTSVAAVTTVTDSKRSTSKNPVKTPAKTPVKSANKSTIKKQPVVEAAAKKVSEPKLKVKKAEKTQKVEKTTETRSPNIKPTSIDVAGLGVGPAKVKKVLTTVSFNPVEYAVRKAILEAENRPVRAAPTADQSDPAVSEQGKQVPVSELSAEVRAVVESAEQAHLQSLAEKFDSHKLSTFSEVERASFDRSKQEADCDAKTRGVTFDLHAHLHDYVSSNVVNYQAEFAEFCKTADAYAIGRVIKNKNGVERERFNQWTRAMALVNKSCLRLSSGVRDALACFLDKIVVQYAHNGIMNCVAEGHSNLHLRHAVNYSNDFSNRVPLDAFTRTLHSYQAALSWLEACKVTRDEMQKLRVQIKKGEASEDTVLELPKYPVHDFEENFEGYVVEICRSVRIQLANSQVTEEEKSKFHNIKISESFKRFCSDMIYESILRIGAHLKEVVALKAVKTVNESLIYHTIRQLCHLCGVDYEPVARDMSERLLKFKQYCVARREKRRVKHAAKSPEDATAGVDSDEEDDTEYSESEE